MRIRVALVPNEFLFRDNALCVCCLSTRLRVFFSLSFLWLGRFARVQECEHVFLFSAFFYNYIFPNEIVRCVRMHTCLLYVCVKKKSY